MLAIGNPFAVGQTVTHGIVSAVARTQVGITDYQFFIQTDAAINPGNSGGALVDLAGRLVGINTAIFSRSGGSQGIGFAIPVQYGQSRRRFRQERRLSVRRPWLGARLQAVTPEIAETASASNVRSARSLRASVREPGCTRRLEHQRPHHAIDGQPIDDPNAFDYRFATKPIGGSARLDVIRGGKEIEINVTLAGRPTRRMKNL